MRQDLRWCSQLRVCSDGDGLRISKDEEIEHCAVLVSAGKLPLQLVNTMAFRYYQMKHGAPTVSSNAVKAFIIKKHQIHLEQVDLWAAKLLKPIDVRLPSGDNLRLQFKFQAQSDNWSKV